MNTTRTISMPMAVNRGLIAERWIDDDGYWIALKSGWQVVGDPTCHQIHEDNYRDAMRYSIEPCECKNCKEQS